MFGVLLAFGAVYGIVSLMISQADNPTIKLALQKTRLATIAHLPDDKITLDKAEDGLVLARKFGEFTLVKRFERLVALLKKHRPRK